MTAEDDELSPPIDPAMVIRLRNIESGLRDISSVLDDIIFDILRQASRKGEGRPPLDKTLSQARRAIDKAIHLLDIERR